MATNIIFISGIILLTCALSSKVLYRYGIPTLVMFLAVGMFMGSEGLGGIHFDNHILAKNICDVGLLFIMFSGGLDTNWKTARPVAASAATLATLGVALTALIIGIFAYLVLGFSFLEGMLLGSIVSSTDAAAVFSILRSKQLNLTHNLAPLLEMESGSNDPMANMLTIIFISLLLGQDQNIGGLLLAQILVGLVVGALAGKGGVWLVNRIKLDVDGLYSIIVIGIALLSYSIASLTFGNGFLAVYVTGLILGNSRMEYRISLVRYFDGISWLAQILLFFTLGLLVYPSKLPGVALLGLGAALFIIFVARPLVVFAILTIFKRPVKDNILISWVGFRGASSIVFATYPLTAGLAIADDIFNIVFFVAVVSVLIQGTLLAPIAKKLGLIDPEEKVLKTFTDYSGDIHAELLEVSICQNSRMVGKMIKHLDIPMEVLIVIIKRGGNLLIPRGNTIIEAEDILMLAGDHHMLMAINERAKEETLNCFNGEL